LEPLPDVVEAHVIRDIIDNNDAVCSSIVTGCDGAKPKVESQKRFYKNFFKRKVSLRKGKRKRKKCPTFLAQQYPRFVV
jgi:hypothetical protein